MFNLKNVAKHKLKYAHFDSELGVSTVIISTNLGDFCGQAHLHPEDAARGLGSEITGCVFAEYRALIKYFKAGKKDAKVQLDVLKQYYAIISSYKDFNKDSLEARKCRRCMYDIEQAILNYDGLITLTNSQIKNRIKAQDKVAKYFTKNMD